MHIPPTIMSIAGSDSGGGAGIQADIKTIMALGCYGTTVITALTAQNGLGVFGICAPDPDFVKLQLNTILNGFSISAAKTGMLYSSEIITEIAPILKERNYPLVVDPVCMSQSGNQLLQDEAVNALKEYIIPDCDLLTPNIPEAGLLTGLKIENIVEIHKAGQILREMGARAVLIKGGHLGGAVVVTDYLFENDNDIKELEQAKIETGNNHGTGCTLSAAIACGLGRGLPLSVSISRAQKFLNEALRKSYQPGEGSGPVNHAWMQN